LALKHTVAMKNNEISDSVPAAHGARSRALSRTDQIAIAAYTARISVQNSIDPACPPQNAEKT
jgi:hypothetical protein